MLSVGKLTMLPEQRRATWDGTHLALTSTEFNLLEVLARHAGRPATSGCARQARLSHAVTSIEAGPPAGFMLDSATVALKYGGLPALREIVGQMTRYTVYAIDPMGRELLGREVTPAVLAQARRELAAPGGQRLLAFVPRHLHAGASAGKMRPGSRPDGGGPGPRSPLGPGWHWSKPIPLMASVIVSLLFALLLAWYFSRPIRALRNAFEAAAAGDLAPRFADGKSSGGDELNDLGRDFDRMSRHLRALMDGQRRLLHQPPDKFATSLERIERASVRMDKLVGVLLTLSRLEASPDLPRTELVDMQELVDGIASELTLRADGEWVHVDVLDRGPGIAPDDLPTIFQPFVRSQPSKNNVDSHGLGLAIAERVVQAHGGTIRAMNREGGWLQVAIVLPLAR